jgi:hypothetical protein
MRGEHQLLRVGEQLVTRACRRLPPDIRAERYREWTGELPAILHDPDVRFAWRRALRMLGYAADIVRATTATPATAAGPLRSPAVLMAVYLGLFVYMGPWLALGSGPAHRNVVQVMVAVVLADLAMRGSRAARVVMITYSVLGLAAILVVSPASWSMGASALRFDALACYLAQICVLVSTPMYLRTRPRGSSDPLKPGQFLLAPPVWMVLASAAAGVIATLLPFDLGGQRTVACRPGHPAAHFGPCLAQGTGYPFTYSYSGGITQISRAGDVRWLNLAAPHGIQAAAFTADWGMWSVCVLLVLYLMWLDRRREHAVAAARPTSPANR